MSQYIELHATHPNMRTINIIADGLRSGALIAYPTDSGYALGCCVGMRKPLERMQIIRRLDSHHNYTLICQDISEISEYARVDNPSYRILKRCTPGGYTFILPATHDVPKLMLAKRKTVGVRIPDHQIALSIAQALGQPLLSTTLIMPGERDPLVMPEDVSEKVGKQVDMIIDGGYCGYEPTTVVDLTHDVPEILRYGSGDTGLFE